MDDLTPKDVQAGIKQFKDVDESLIKQDMNTAVLQAKSDQIQDPNAYKAAVLAYTRHLLLCDQFDSNGGVTNASVMGQSQAVANPNNYSNGDHYLQTYNKLAENYGNPVTQGRVISENGTGSFDLY